MGASMVGEPPKNQGGVYFQADVHFALMDASKAVAPWMNLEPVCYLKASCRVPKAESKAAPLNPGLTDLPP
jgi:hypothetical protein